LDQPSVGIFGRPERHDVAALDGPLRKESLHSLRVIGRKGDLIEKEVIADQNRGDHRTGRHYRRLGDMLGEQPNKSDRYSKTLHVRPYTLHESSGKDKMTRSQTKRLPRRERNFQGVRPNWGPWPQR